MSRASQGRARSGLAESLVRLDLKTSKRNTYAAPLAKSYAGEFKRFAPG
ncbi:MAG TPA: hydantoin racemase [Roseiarcus sp.]